MAGFHAPGSSPPRSRQKALHPGHKADAQLYLHTSELTLCAFKASSSFSACIRSSPRSASTAGPSLALKAARAESWRPLLASHSCTDWS